MAHQKAMRRRKYELLSRPGSSGMLVGYDSMERECLGQRRAQAASESCRGGGTTVTIVDCTARFCALATLSESKTPYLGDGAIKRIADRQPIQSFEVRVPTHPPQRHANGPLDPLRPGTHINYD